MGGCGRRLPAALAEEETSDRTAMTVRSSAEAVLEFAEIKFSEPGSLLSLATLI